MKCPGRDKLSHTSLCGLWDYSDCLLFVRLWFSDVFLPRVCIIWEVQNFDLVATEISNPSPAWYAELCSNGALATLPFS